MFMAIHYTTCLKRGGAGCFQIRNSAFFIRKSSCISVKLRINPYTWRGKWKTRKAGTGTGTGTETETEIRKRSSDLKVSIVRVDGNSMQVCWYGDG